MKWGGSSNKVGKKLFEAVGKVFGTKGLMVLLSIIAFSLLAGAGAKWGI